MMDRNLEQHNIPTSSSLASLDCLLLASDYVRFTYYSPIVPTFNVGRLYQQNCTVELLIRIPPMSYTLMRGANSPLTLWLV